MSGFLTEFLDRQRRDGTPGAEIWRGLIAAAPADVTEKVAVTLPAYEADLTFGPCRWTPRVEPHDFTVDAVTFTAARVVLPAKGDSCLVGFDENDEPWILLYWSGP